MVWPQAVTFSHMGGIDEIGMFVVPAALVLWYFRRSERRAREKQEAASQTPGVEAPPRDH